jgi:DNA replication protein DnaC
VAACRQKRRVRFATAAALVNELVEAKQKLQLRPVPARWDRYELIAIDEVGYVPMADLGADLLFQVIAERAEKAAVILAANLPFSEWTQVIPNARLCKTLQISTSHRLDQESCDRWAKVNCRKWAKKASFQAQLCLHLQLAAK